MNGKTITTATPAIKWLVEGVDDGLDLDMGGSGDTSERRLTLLDRRDRRDNYMGSFESIVQFRDRARETGVLDLEESFPKPPSAAEYQPAEDGVSFDERNLGQFVGGNWSIEELYEEREIVHVGRQVVGISIDMSGSMRGDERSLKETFGDDGYIRCELSELADALVDAYYREISPETVGNGGGAHV